MKGGDFDGIFWGEGMSIIRVGIHLFDFIFGACSSFRPSRLSGVNDFRGEEGICISFVSLEAGRIVLGMFSDFRLSEWGDFWKGKCIPQFSIIFSRRVF